jgi:translocation and assembly module TamB
MALNSAKLLELFLSPEHIIKGDIKGKIKISGNLNSPQFFGNISLKNGSYNYLPMQINLNKITLALNLNNRSINLTNFHAEDAKGNKIISKGKVNFTNFRQYEYNLNLATKKFELLNHPRFYGIISGNITVAGNDKAGEIRGTLQSDLIEIRLPERIIQNIPELNIVATIPNNSSKLTTLGSTQKPYIMALNIGIRADRKVFIRGLGLDAELQGKLSLRGTTSDLEISGKLNSIRGRYEEFGKNLYLKKAELLFEGKVPPSPFLNIIGSITQSDVEIKVILTGSVKNPLLRIESIPIMPQEDVLSLLLFGKTATKITPIQVIQLAASLKKLLGKGGSIIDPLGKIRNLFGVDNISVTNNTVNDDTTIGVGKYIGNKVYFEVERGIQAGSEKAHVEIEISPRIFIESDTSATSESSLGINWKYEY